MRKGDLLWPGAALACAGAALVGLRLEARASGSLAPRPVHRLQRTAQVLDANDSAYLADFFWSKKESWTQTYFNMLVHRWNNHDKRMGLIFDKVIRAANAVEGGCGDYTITNDFFSYRAPGVVQFALDGMFHMDCDFWKTPSSDGFNLWILIDHSGLNTSFDILEHERNEAVYQKYDSRWGAILKSRNGSDPGSSFRTVPLKPLFFRRGHSDVLGWRGCVHLAFRKALMWWSTRRSQGKGRHEITEVAPSNVELARGEALVLREQEFHRTDLHKEVGPGQFRVVAGFKMQRSNATISEFNMFCTAQKDRYNIPELWERVGAPLQHIYSVDPGRKLVHMSSFPAKISALLAANSYTLSTLAVAGVAARLRGKSTCALAAVATATLALFALVVCVQLEWFRSGGASLEGEGSRIRSSVN